MSWQIARCNVNYRGNAGEQIVLVFNRHPDPPEKPGKAKAVSPFNHFRDDLVEQYLRDNLGESQELKNLRIVEKRLADMEALGCEFDTRVALEAIAEQYTAASITLDGAEFVTKLAALKVQRVELESKLAAYQEAVAELKAQREQAMRQAAALARSAAYAARNEARHAAAERMKAVTKSMVDFSGEKLSEYVDLDEALRHLEALDPIERKAGQMVQELTAAPAK